MDAVYGRMEHCDILKYGLIHLGKYRVTITEEYRTCV